MLFACLAALAVATVIALAAGDRPRRFGGAAHDFRDDLPLATRIDHGVGVSDDFLGLDLLMVAVHEQVPESRFGREQFAVDDQQVGLLARLDATDRPIQPEQPRGGGRQRGERLFGREAGFDDRREIFRNVARAFHAGGHESEFDVGRRERRGQIRRADDGL